MLLVLSGFAFISMQRTMLWNDKLTFMQDAVAKSPGFGSLYNELGGILLQRGETDRAADAFATADKLNKRSSMHLLIKANLLGVQFVKGNYSGVRAMFFQVFKDKKEAPADFLELLQKADSRRMATLSGKDKILLAKDLLETLDLLNQKRYDPFWLYRSGQLSLIIGDEAKAADFFSRSYKAAPADAHYRKAAEIYLHKFGSIQ
jgi:tetratricopeptide (TPR) repeat protein